MTAVPTPGEKVMRLRYAGTCRACGSDLPAGTRSAYDRSTKSVRCLDCLSVEAPAAYPSVATGVAGASARRKHQKHRADREQRVRAAHPKLGGLFLAMSNDPQSTTAWAVGATGEERLGAQLDKVASDTVRVLHDRRLRPGSKANIDHVVVTRAGVFVVDAKKYAGRPTLRVDGGLIRPRTERLFVGGRDRTGLIAKMAPQVDRVGHVVGDAVAVHGVLCFVDADWPLLGGRFTVRGVDVVSPRRLCSQLSRAGDLSGDVVATLHRGLAAALPPA